MPQAQMQTVTIDGQEAIYIPASVQHAPTAAAATQQIQIAGNQAIFAPAGQIIRAQNIIQNVQSVGQVREEDPSGLGPSTRNCTWEFKKINFTYSFTKYFQVQTDRLYLI